jgi:ESS family glutamate:Na+ symporter
MAQTFPGVIAFAFLALMLLIGTVLRARIPFLRTNLVPASLIGGLLGFALINTGFGMGHSSADFTAFTFHFFTLSFMSLCLTGRSKTAVSGKISTGGSWLSVVWTMSLVLQALVGLGIVLMFNAFSGDDLSVFLGILATHGFTQGPGQALAMGSIWASEFDIARAVDFGLIYASVGFIVAFAIGIPIARWAVTKGLNVNRQARIDTEFLTGMLRETNLSCGRQITHPANVDTLAWHLGILGAAYVVTDAYLGLMAPLAAEVTLFGANMGVIFSHNLFFFHGLMVCVAMRAVIDRLGFGHYIDDETQRRITGSAVDLMVAATIMSIQFGLLAAYFLPILLVCAGVSLATASLCFGFGRRLTSLGIERGLTAFGCCCGSTGSGLLLLRILDPDLSTPLARELAFFNIAILFVSAHILMFMAPLLPSFSLTSIVTVYAGTFVLGAIGLFFIERRLTVAPTG